MAFTRSAAAIENGTCCTKEEAAAFYKTIPAEKKAPALKALKDRHQPEDAAKIRDLIKRFGEAEWLWHMYDAEIANMDPDLKARGFGAMLNPHHQYGMAVRNFLRHEGFGEEYFGAHNLDCIYIPLVTEALREEVAA